MQIASTTALVGTAIISPFAKCFVAGTAVMTENGAIAIEEIEIGMFVYASNDENIEEKTLKEVKQLFVSETDELTNIRISNGQTLKSTPTHPYYALNKGWIKAKDLKVGDILLTLNGSSVIIELIEHELLESPIKVYNFEVEDYHTYYVAEYINANAEQFVLTHNACYKNGLYEKAPYHNKGNSIKSAAPKNGQAALDNSIQVKVTSPRRLGYSENQFVVLDQTRLGIYHGHVRSFSELNNVMKNIARKIFGVKK